MHKVLVIGSNGNTGKRVVNQLVNHKDYEPIAMLRNESQQPYFEQKNIEVRMGDLEKDLDHVFQDVDKVIFAAGSGGNTGDDKTEAVDKDGAIKVVNQSEKSAINKFVMLSSMGTDIPDKIKGLEVYLKAKKAADDHLRASSLNYSIIQPGGLTDEEGKNQIRASEKIGEFGQISRDDVAQALVESLDKSVLNNKSAEIIEGERAINEALKDI